MKDFLDKAGKLSQKQLMLLALELQSKLDAKEKSQYEPLAIIGVGCRFPGGVRDLDSYWNLLDNHVDAIGEIPSDRWDVDAYYDPDPGKPGKMYTRFGGFLDNVDMFDPHFFGIAPREANNMDPQQRLLLEVAWESLENAGWAANKLEESRTGVYIGISGTDYGQTILSGDPKSFDAYVASGSSHAIASGRLSYVLGLRGPSMSIDTACSSSLVALHMACLGLRSGDCNMALAGGVNLILAPETTITLCRASMMAPDGRCKAFDASANGFVRSEGCGVVVLKRLSDALSDGDRILALVRGSAVNQDGRSSGITSPNGPSQEDVIRRALANGNITPNEVNYIETHGTGTALGDPIEAQALGAVFDKHERPLLIGSVKTNIGHAESAAGIAGLIKIVAALQHQQIPAHLHFTEPNTLIPWQDLPLQIPDQGVDWWAGKGMRIAGVSSFGFSGTNAHVLLQQAPESVVKKSDTERPQHIFCVSAQTEQALQELVKTYKPLPEENLVDMCFTANAGRTHFGHRLAVLTESRQMLQDGLDKALQHKGAPNLLLGTRSGTRQPDVAFLFSGQGAQYTNMGRTLYETQPTFCRSLDQSNQLLREHMGMDLLSVLYPESGEKPAIDQTQFTQPALFAIEMALAELWHSWGLEPTAVLGHSIGEFAAACVAGVMSAEDGLCLVAERGRLMQALPQNGVMVAVFAGEQKVLETIAESGPEVAIAAINGPDNTVISGGAKAVRAVADRLQAEGIQIRDLPVSHAFHSPLMDAILDEFETAVSKIRLTRPKLDLISNLTGAPVDGDEICKPSYWRNHIRQAVCFEKSMRSLFDQGFRVFVEVGPHPALLGMARTFGPDDALWLASLRKGKEDWPQLLESVGNLYVNGIDLDWTGFDSDYPRARVTLPTYPFQRESHWLEKETGGHRRNAASGQVAVSTGHPLLGNLMNAPITTFQGFWTRDSLAMLASHQADGVTVVPAAVFLETIFAAARRHHKSKEVRVQDLTVHQALSLPESDSRLVQTLVFERERGITDIRVFAQENGEWQLYASATAAAQWVALDNGTRNGAHAVTKLKKAVKQAEKIDLEDFYQRLERRGVAAAKEHRVVKDLWQRRAETIARVEMTARVGDDSFGYGLHPALIDACLQVPEPSLERSADDTLHTYMLLGATLCQHVDVKEDELWVSARLKEGTKDDVAHVDIDVFSKSGQHVASLEGLQFVRIEAGQLSRSNRRAIADWLYDVKWVEKPRLHVQAAPLKPLPQVIKNVTPDISRLKGENDLEMYDRLSPALDALCGAYVVQALQYLGFSFSPRQRIDLAKLMQDLRIQDQHERLVESMLDMLTGDGLLLKVDEAWQVSETAPDASATDTEMQRLMETFPACAPELKMIGRCGSNLAAALKGEVDALQLLFPDGSTSESEKLYSEAPAYRAFNSLMQRCMQELLSTLPKGRRIRVLEIGAGTGGTTASLLSVLQDYQTDYVFTDVSPLFLAKAQEKFAAYPFVSYQLLDIEKNLEAQELSGHFDIVIASNVLHATKRLRETVAQAKSLLAPEGILLLLEGVQPHRFSDLTVGLTSGWWGFEDNELRPSYALLSRESWLALLQKAGFDEVMALPENDDYGEALRQQAIFVAKSTPGRQEKASPDEAAAWLIFADRNGFHKRVQQALERRGERSVLVRPGKAYQKTKSKTFRIAQDRDPDYSKVLSDPDNKYRGVIHLWSLDAPKDNLAASGQDIERAQIESTGSVLRLVKALTARRASPVPRMCLVTSKAQAVVEQDSVSGVLQSPLWGLSRVVTQEHPEVRCLCLDVDDSMDLKSADFLVDEILASDNESQVALRHGQRYVPRLNSAEKSPSLPEPQLSADATYLIVGGLSGLGLLTARWMAEQGARHLVLVGRRGAHDESKATLHAIGELVTDLVVEKADVSDKARMSAVLKKIQSNMPPLRGVIHSAGVLQDGLLLQQEWSDFHKVFAPKVMGAWILHQLICELKLDFFVLYSSGASLVGTNGQGNHAAANAFLDALAFHRRANGLPALSINWGAWSGFGAAANQEVERQIQAHGMDYINPEDGLRSLALVLGINRPQVAVLPVNWSQHARSLTDRGAPSLLIDLMQPLEETMPSGRNVPQGTDLLVQLKKVAPNKKRQTVLNYIRQQAKVVLGVDSSRPLDQNQPLSECGLDSLMAIELRNDLGRAINRSLPATLLFEYPTIESLTGYLMREVGGLSETEAPEFAREGQTEAENLDDLSEGQLADMLSQRLNKLEGISNG